MAPGSTAASFTREVLLEVEADDSELDDVPDAGEDVVEEEELEVLRLRLARTFARVGVETGAPRVRPASAPPADVPRRS